MKNGFFLVLRSFLLICAFQNTLQFKQPILNVPLFKKRIAFNSTPVSDSATLASTYVSFAKTSRVPINTTLNGIFFYGRVSVGTPPQYFNAEFDTGSTFLWITSKLCDKKKYIACRYTNAYNHNASSTYKPTKKKYALEYGTAETSGVVSKDTIGIGGIFIKDHPFGEATKSKSNYPRSNIDGIFGLGFRRKTQIPTIMSTMISRRLIAQPIFTFYYKKNFTTENAGEVTFGGENNKRYKGKFAYVPVVRETFSWDVKIYKFYVGKRDVLNGRSIVAAIDTGSSHIFGPSKFITDFIASVNKKYFTKKKFPHIQCKYISKLPKIKIVLKTTTLQIDSRDYTIKDEKNADCELLFSEIPTLPVKFILSTSVLRNYYLKFNVKRGNIGFAEAV